MSRLFVVHTQYNLILATGMAQTGDDLVLFRDFALTDELKTRLEGCFARCLFLEGNYPQKDLSAKEKHRKIRRDCAAIKAFIQPVYDEILVVDDMCIPEMAALKYACQKNRHVAMAWLEDGANAYFANGAVSGGMGATPLKRFIRRVFFTVQYGLYGFYDLAVCMGGHKRLTAAYLTFPENARPELRQKDCRLITQEQFQQGLRNLYAGEPVAMDDNSVIIAVDKFNVYGDNLAFVEGQIAELVEKAAADGKTVYCKYHPRETGKLAALRQATELDAKIALEYYLANTTAKRITVVGVVSAALQTAKKLGYSVVSLADSCGSNQQAVDFYKHIGIEVK